MLMEEYKKWGFESGSCKEDTDANFMIFYNGRCMGESPMYLFYDLAKQIHDLQVCVEGLIEDQGR